MNNKRLAVVALGDFDGVHLGHKMVFDAALSYAKELVPTVYSFTENSKGAPLITDIEQRKQLFCELGIKKCVFDQFESVKSISAEQFAADILCRRLKAGAVVCGYNYTFGKMARGDVLMLIRLGRQLGFEVTVAPPCLIDGEIVSSTTIRKYISCGEIAHANNLLGRPFEICGTVMKGAGIGGKMGFPTINIPLKSGMVCPAFGVYASKAAVDGVCYHGVTNIGVHPSLNESDKPVVETHLFDCNMDLYNKSVRISLFELLRYEKKFANINELRTAIKNDCRTAASFFGGTGVGQSMGKGGLI